MEQDRKEKAPVPVEVWALVVRGKEKAAAKEAAGDKVVDRAVVADRDGGKLKVAGRGRGRDKAVNRIGELI